MKVTIYNLSLFITLFIATHLSAQNITTFAGTNTGFLGDGGSAAAAKMNLPLSCAKDATGNVYIADANNNRIRSVSPTGIIQTIAGSGTAGYAGDGGPASAAHLQHPTDVKVDPSGNILVCDAYNCCIRRISTSGIITTVAGMPGSAGFGGDGAAAVAAMLDTPAAMAVDGTGNIYVADRGNNRIRLINTSGVITTFAGNGGMGLSGLSGPATAASIERPAGVAVDGTGNVYISLPAQNRVLKVNAATGNINYFAGNGTAGFGGDGSAATAAMLSSQQGICIDAIGNVYIADLQNQRVRKVNTLGDIYTVAGSGFVGCCTDGNPATMALMHDPSGVMVDDSGRIYIADAANARIRKVASMSNTDPVFVSGPRASYLSCQGSVMNLSTTLGTYLATAGETLTWSEIVAPMHGSVSGLPTVMTSTSLMMFPTASVLYTPATTYSGVDSFTFEVTNGTVSDTLTVVASIAPNPDPGIITGPTEVCEHESITLSNPATGGAWYSPTPALATVSSAGVVTGVSAGTAVISYLSTNSCATLAATYNVTVRPAADCSTGVSLARLSGKIMVAPNPAGGVFTITLPESILQPARVTLTDLPGREIEHWEMAASRLLQVSVDVPPGMYFLSVWSNGRRDVVTVTIQ